MINVFSKNLNTIGNLAIVLLFLGGCVFMFTGSWNTSETEAASSCCGGTATNDLAAPSTVSIDGCCADIGTVSSSDNCGCVSSPCECGNNPACGTGNQRTKPACPDNASCTNTGSNSDPCTGTCNGRICNRDDKCNGNC